MPFSARIPRACSSVARQISLATCHLPPFLMTCTVAENPQDFSRPTHANKPHPQRAAFCERDQAWAGSAC
jgi:hypothetical protein